MNVVELASLNTQSFIIEEAKKVGLKEAIILSVLKAMLCKNFHSKRNIHNGHVWTFVNLTSFCGLFPYLTESEINSSIQKLINSNMLMVIKVGPSRRLAYYSTPAFRTDEKGGGLSGEDSFTGESVASDCFVSGIYREPIGETEMLARLPNPVVDGFVSNKISTIIIENAFSMFWNAGLKKISKGRCFELFRSYCKEMSHSEVMAFTEFLVEDVRTKLANAKSKNLKTHPFTYLKNEDWLQEKPTKYEINGEEYLNKIRILKKKRSRLMAISSGYRAALRRVSSKEEHVSMNYMLEGVLNQINEIDLEMEKLGEKRDCSSD